jgi:hypothetical protein
MPKENEGRLFLLNSEENIKYDRNHNPLAHVPEDARSKPLFIKAWTPAPLRQARTVVCDTPAPPPGIKRRMCGAARLGTKVQETGKEPESTEMDHLYPVTLIGAEGVICDI